MGKYQKNIEAARSVTIMQYLATCHPGELVRKTDDEYCTKTHSSLVITPSKDLFHWFSQNIGGRSALDYMTNVERVDFVSAVRFLNNLTPVPVSSQMAKMPTPTKQQKSREFELPKADKNCEAVVAYLMHRGISPKVLRYCVGSGILYQTTRGSYVFASGQTLANYFYQRGRLGSHITAGNTALILRAHPLACAVMSADEWSKYGRRVSKGCTGIAQIVRSNGYYSVAKVFDISQTYGNKPYPIAAVESTKQIEKAIDVMREISPIPVLPKNEVEGFCYDAERQELVFCAAMPPQELLQRLPAEIVMAAAESAYASISENELLRQTAAAVAVEVCGRLGLPMPPDAFQTLEGMREHIPDGEERRALEKVREMAVTFGDAVCKRLKLERGQPAPQREER